MLEQFIFENHLGQRFVGLENGVYMNYNQLRNYSWKYESINNRISRFYRAISSQKIPLVVHCRSDEEATAVKNRLMELAEVDIEAMLPGRVYVGEYYINCYITASAKSNYLISKRLCNIELTLTSDNPVWYREQSYSFFPGTGGTVAVGGDGTDYPYDYPYDYAFPMNGRKIMCNSVGSNEFRMRIYGDITNPSVVIGGHTYTINGTIGEGESLLIDSLDKTITLTTAKGNKINWFDKRSRDNYIFEPIPAGQNVVSWLGVFGFDLTVIEKRSEPRWT